MTPDAQREEAVNVRLADLLSESGASARAETIVRSGRRKKFPDVRVEWAGLRIVIEAKYEGPGAAADVEAQVEERLQDALGDVGVALLYPDELKRATNVQATLRRARLRAKFAAPGREGQWQTLSGVTDLSRSFEYARALLIDDDAVIAATEQLEEAVQTFENAVEAQPGRREPTQELSCYEATPAAHVSFIGIAAVPRVRSISMSCLLIHGVLLRWAASPSQYDGTPRRRAQRSHLFTGVRGRLILRSSAPEATCLQDLATAKIVH